MPSPAKSPRHLRILKSTLQRCRDESPSTPGLRAIDGVPTPPAWLTNPDALREWHRLAPVLVVNRLLTVGNVSLFAQSCALHGKFIEMREAGTTPSASLLSVHRRLLGDLGLTHMAVSVPTGRSNIFSDLAKRHR